MNLIVLRFGHHIAPFKERIFNRMHYNLVKLLAHKKASKKKNKKSNLQFHIIKELEKKARKLHHS